MRNGFFGLLALAVLSVSIGSAAAEDSQRVKDLAVMIAGDNAVEEYYLNDKVIPLRRREAPILVAVLRENNEQQTTAAAIADVIHQLANNIRDSTTPAMPKVEFTDDPHRANLVFALGKSFSQLQGDSRWSFVAKEQETMKALLNQWGLDQLAAASGCISYTDDNEQGLISNDLIVIDSTEADPDIVGCAFLKFLNSIGIDGSAPKTASIMNPKSYRFEPSPFDWQALRVLYGRNAVTGADLMKAIRAEVGS